jgi:hypothetical protein
VENAEECTNCDSDVSEVIQDTSEAEALIVSLTGDDVVDVSGEVLAENDTSDYCVEVDSESIIDMTSKSCREQDLPVEYDANDGASKNGELINISNAKVTMESVTYPLLLWKGKYTVKSTNKEISLEDPVYNANGEQIDMDKYRSYYAPDVASRKEAEIEELDYYRDPFEVVGNIEMKEADAEGDMSAVVSPSSVEVSSCGAEFTENDYNPETSNKMSTNLYPVLQAPDSDGNGIGDDYDSISTPSCLPNDNIVTISSSTGLGSACKRNLLEITRDFLSNIFGSNKWDNDCNCKENDEGRMVCEDGCVDPENITIKMSPIFGNLETCEDGVCTNVYMTNSVRGQMSPDQASTETFQIATPCKIRITADDGNGPSKIYSVQCLWDATPVLMNYYQQQINTIPNQEDFPQSFDIYWKSVLQALEENK